MATVMFQGADEVPPILSTEISRVMHADLFMDYDAAAKRPNRGGGIIKGSMKNPQADLVGSSVDWCNEVIPFWGRRWYHIFFTKSGAMPMRIDEKCALNVLMSRSAALCLLISGGTSW